MLDVCLSFIMKLYTMYPNELYTMYPNKLYTMYPNKLYTMLPDDPLPDGPCWILLPVRPFL